MKAMVLAAGVGSRLEPLTNQVPKPLVPVANMAVMEHLLRLLHKHGIKDIICNLHYLPHQVEKHFADTKALGVNLTMRYERELSGDAGGVRACRDFLEGETFIVLMGDLLTDADISKVVAEHKAKKALATIAVKAVEDVRHFGVVVRDKDGFITGFQEKPEPEEALSNYASTGIYVLEPEVFNHIPATGSYGFGRQLFPALVEKGQKVLGVSIDEYYWSDVGTINQYCQSNFDVLNGLAKIDFGVANRPWGYAAEGASVDPTASISGKLLLGKNTKIDANVRLSGNVIIGDDCRVEAGATIHDTIIWSGTTVGQNATVTDSVIGSGCQIAAGKKVVELASVCLTDAKACKMKEVV